MVEYIYKLREREHLMFNLQRTSTANVLQSECSIIKEYQSLNLNTLDTVHNNNRSMVYFHIKSED